VASLRITEIFYSLQGESNTVGIPTVFIRLTGCPLRCDYCDTAYAFTGGKKIAIAEIISQAEQYDTKYITVTGGEPLAQPACLDLITRLLDKGFSVSLETSGAMDVVAVDPRAVKVMDLKTPSSGELSKNLYQNIHYLNHKDQVKFVIGNDEDYNWSKWAITEYGLPGRCDILFSPVMGQQNPTELAEKILQDRLPVRFQIQLHKLLWDDAQGK
jgi:7-carboxy-7-deazaguanine synthase